ncbi:MAG: hypothetical protein H6618_06120 [Deltaproteobacteria bacterium]|nr:hypothetical protein [Deltaproteobacteria bacterium]
MNEPHIRKTYALILIFMAGASSLQCQTDFNQQTLAIRMLGVFEEPLYLSGDESCNDASTDADGWFEPLNQNFTMLNVTVNYSDPDTGTTDDLILYDGDPETFRITYRTQRIFKKEISTAISGVDLTGKTINSISVTFLDEISGASQYQENHLVILGSAPAAPEEGACQQSALLPCQTDDSTGECTVRYSTPFEIGQGKSYTFTLRVHWKRSIHRVDDNGTLQDISMLSPTLELIPSDH